MTSLALARRRLAISIAATPLYAIVLLVLLAAVLGAGVSALVGKSEAAATGVLTVQLSPARAAALVAATSSGAEQTDLAAGEAELINASLPFSAAPVEAARPFLAAQGLDERRALLCLTQAVYYEAGFEPIAGRRAVAQVVLNRMRHPAFPNSICGVVYQGSRSPVCQFSFVCDGSLYRAPAPAAWSVARSIAQAALDGHVEGSVGAATHYHADYVSPRWAPMLAKITKLGAHIFYRWPGAWGRPSAFTGRYGGEPQDPAALRPPASAAPVQEDVMAEMAAVAEIPGPPVPRAANDVGGLLDVSKGWTLTISSPQDVASRSAEVVSRQQQPDTKALPSVASAATPAGGH